MDEDRAIWKRIDELRESDILRREELARIQAHMDHLERRQVETTQCLSSLQKQIKEMHKELKQSFTDLDRHIASSRVGIRIGIWILGGMATVAGLFIAAINVLGRWWTQ